MIAAPAWTHVALLRGINVGGKNIIRMADLQACLLADGIEQVRTYIQSGNVLLRSPDRTPALETRLERAIAKAFRSTTAVVVCSRKQMGEIVDAAPRGFGRDDGWRYNVLYCKRPLTPREVRAAVTPKPGVDEVAIGKDVVYFATLKSRATSSALPRLISTPVYQRLTIRNWNTTVKLAELLSTA